jgi:hypothetical protein
VCEAVAGLKGAPAIPARPPVTGPKIEPVVRATMTIGDAVGIRAAPSTRSIAWRGSLSDNGHDDNVARITSNVLRPFLDRPPSRVREGCPLRADYQSVCSRSNQMLL